MLPESLPVGECLPEVVACLERSQPVILRAPPGAGKTTGVPPALLRSKVSECGKILLLQPRRIAARAAARRLSQLAGEPVGKTYGYHVRFDRQVGRETRVIAMTTGILLRQLVGDPLLEDVGCVILDEFHERSLELDVVLGMLHRVRTTLRPELRLVVMSATLETESLSRLMPDAATIESQGRAYDVDVRYSDELAPQVYSRDAIAEKAASCVRRALKETDGHLLVFFPGVGEIHRAADKLANAAANEGVELHKLYGDQLPADQDRVFAVSENRKLVLATNLAETSVTIDGITCVVDTGLARVMTFDSGVGIPSLKLQPISLASADQRAGRAGRTAPGVCYRLWPKALERGRSSQTAPEILRTDLSGAILALAAWGEREILDFPWVSPPSPHAVEAGRQLLVHLGAMNDSGGVTDLGIAMNRLPVHPRLSRLLIASSEFRCVDEAALLAAMLSERDPFDRRSSPGNQGRRDQDGDVLNRVRRLQQAVRGKHDDEVSKHAVKQLQKVSDRLKRLLESGDSAAPPQTEDSLDERFGRALLAAFPDRLAKRRHHQPRSAVMVGGRGVRFNQTDSSHSADLVLCIKVDGDREESVVRLAFPVELSWLSKHVLVEKTECFYREATQSVVARKRTYWHDLLIEESPAECLPNEHTAGILYEQVRDSLLDVLPDQDKPLVGLIARWRFLQERGCGEQLPGDIDRQLDGLLQQFCKSATSVKTLSRAPWSDHLRGQFSYEQWQWFETHAPESIVVPSGNRIRLRYEAGKSPVLPVRIQEIYGWVETPRVAGGMIPVQLHLLGPNRRPQQITDDLESFWDSTYLAIKKELKRRYSKHHWPDDPRTAKATSNGLKPRPG